jgi:hypothetical protein
VSTERTAEELKRHFEEQLDFLRVSSERFDQGAEHEAKRLAATIRTVVCDLPDSLLKQLGIKDKLGYVDRGLADPPSPPAFVLGFGLCRIRMSSDGIRFVAADLDDPERQHPPVAFVDWWEHPILFDLEGRSYSRRELIRSLAEKDGGVHIDSHLKSKYGALVASNSMRLEDGSSAPIKNGIVGPSVRHAAAELIYTLETRVRWEASTPIIDDPICSLPLDYQVDEQRNDLCPCGSGRKLKRCFLQRQGRLRQSLTDEGELETVPGPLGAGARPEAPNLETSPLPDRLGFDFLA